MRRIEAKVLERHVAGLKNRSNERDRPAEAAELESFQVPDATTAAARVGSALGEYDIRVRERASDFPAVAQLASGDAYHGVAETTSVLVRNASGLRYPAIGTVADDVQTGARGPASGREFDPEAAGGRSSSSKLRKRESPVKASTKLRLTFRGSLEAVPWRPRSRRCLIGWRPLRLAT
jgi:hypothetical protein